MPAEINFSLGASPTLGRFMAQRDARIEGIMGPFGSGKSSACLMKIIALAHEMPPMGDGIRRSRWAVTRNTYKQLLDTTIRTIHQWLPPVNWGVYRQEKHDYKIEEFEGVEIELMFRALDRPDHVQNLLSLELTGAWGNEARELPREVIGPLFGRTGRYPPRAEVGDYTRRLLLDTNPPDVDSWFYERFEDHLRPGWRLYRQPGGLSEEAENLPFLVKGYYQDMLDVMTDDEVQVYVNGEYGYIASGKPVYPEYKDSFHCREFEVKRAPILRCWDFGLTPACVLLQRQANGQVRVIDEICADRAGITAFGPVAVQYTREHYPWATREDHMLRDIGDPAGKTPSQTDETSCFMLMTAMGIDIEAGKQDPTLRQESIRYLLKTVIDGEPALLVHPRCRRLRKGFQGEYKYRRMMISGNLARYQDKPDKNIYSHPHDAAQYGAVDMVGDLVLGMMRKFGEARQTEAISDFDPFEKMGYSAQHQELNAWEPGPTSEPQQEQADSYFDPFGRY
jgi:hypothetical protein